MKNNEYLYLYSLLLLLGSCSTKESNALVTQNIEEITPNHFGLMDSIKNISSRTKSWKSVDNFYREKVANVTNDELINHTIFWLFNPNANFMDDANVETHEFYLQEASKVSFNRNLRLIVQMLEKVDVKWSDQKMTDYARHMYEKNIEYWDTHFPDQTIYLEKNEKALAALADIQRK